MQTIINSKSIDQSTPCHNLIRPRRRRPPSFSVTIEQPRRARHGRDQLTVADHSFDVLDEQRAWLF